tara:strand:- start:2667 stop:2873 length:207 start_codon:yes stop_codon:yes gene_type:complete
LPTIYQLADLLKMKLRNMEKPHSTRPRIFDGGYEHPWYKHAQPPKPPTKEAVEKAKFVDKTYTWKKNR